MFPESLEHEMLKYGHKYRFLAVSSIFRFVSFAKNFKGEDDEEFFVLVSALVVQMRSHTLFLLMLT